MNRVYKKIKINKKWIEDNIIKREWQRSIYPASVNKFAAQIRNKKFTHSLITVAKDNHDRNYVLLDGQHRLEAIRKENAEFEMDVCIYEDFSDQEMYDEYYRKNSGRAFRLVDDLKGYIALNKYEWLNAFMDKHFPIEVTLHGGLNAMKIGDILVILHGGLRTQILRTSLSRNKLPLFLEDLDAEKYSIMKDFCNLYIKVFGYPHRDNWLYKNFIMTTLMKIWMKNESEFKEEEFIKRFRPMERVSSIRQISSASGFDRTSQEIVVKNIYKVINKGFTKKKMEEFWKEE